ncbi:unnamed protein product, partial [Choristocarpus tenellus]
PVGPDPRKDPEYAKYFLLLEGGVPRPTVERAMVREGKYPAVLNTPMAAPTPPSPAGPPDTPNTGTAPSPLIGTSVAVPATTSGEALPTNLLPAVDHPRYAKFYKMLRAGVPRPAVIQAIRRDGVDEALLDAPNTLFPRDDPILAGSSVAAGTAGDPATRLVPAQNHPWYAKYFKMLEMGLPYGAVVQAMTKNVVDTAILDDPSALFPLPTGETFETASTTVEQVVPVKQFPEYLRHFKMPAKDHPRYKTYFEMVKSGQREIAVQAMTKDGLTPAILDDPNALFLLLGEESSKAKPVSASGSHTLPAKYHPQYAKYFKMLKMGLPHGAAMQAMTKDGVDTAILDDPDALFPLPGSE